MIDGPGPWGSGVFELVEGYSSLRAEIGLVSANPFVCTWLPTDQPRSDRIVLQANLNHWNRDRGPKVGSIVFRNDVNPAEAMVDMMVSMRTFESVQRVMHAIDETLGKGINGSGG